MNFRCWIGLWTALILLIIVVTDASYLVKYITRFTGKHFFFQKQLFGIALTKIIFRGKFCRIDWYHIHL